MFWLHNLFGLQLRWYIMTWLKLRQKYIDTSWPTNTLQYYYTVINYFEIITQRDAGQNQVVKRCATHLSHIFYFCFRTRMFMAHLRIEKFGDDSYWLVKRAHMVAVPGNIFVLLTSEWQSPAMKCAMMASKCYIFVRHLNVSLGQRNYTNQKQIFNVDLKYAPHRAGHWPLISFWKLLQNFKFNWNFMLKFFP